MATNYDRRRVNGPISHPPTYDQPIASTSSSSISAPIFLQTGLVPSASGSSYIERGALKLACSVFGPRQVRGRQYAGKAELNVEVKFAPFSTEKRGKPGKTTESAHLSALVHQALLPSLRLDLLPKASLDIHVMVLETGDGPQQACVAAATIAASTALASAGIEMYGLVVGGVSLTEQGSNILLCGMPALSSVTCLEIDTAGGSKPSDLDVELAKLNKELASVHGILARALAQDYERRQAVLKTSPA